MLDGIRWKPVREFPVYEVSETGEIRNTISGRLMKPSGDVKGNLIVRFRDVHGKKYHTRAVKKLVEGTFPEIYKN